ncbi:MAG: hypothetical protein KDJ54_08740 [Candidatus Competibacteraceae bacterium]|nr:hypothetical protein [Candidatus Competibacteraceae bacterium]
MRPHSRLEYRAGLARAILDDASPSVRVSGERTTTQPSSLDNAHQAAIETGINHRLKGHMEMVGIDQGQHDDGGTGHQTGMKNALF